MLTITREKLKDKIDRADKFILLDVLDEGSFKSGHLPNAINVPFAAKDFAEALHHAVPEKSIPVIVYSEDLHCEICADAAEAIEELGYKIVNVYAEGKEDWRKAGYAIIKQEAFMLAKDIMNKNVDVIHYDKSVKDAAKMMKKSKYGALPVERADKMVGMITDRDIAVRVVAEGKDPAKTTVQECMTKGIDYCFENDKVELLAEKMAASSHRRIPVVNNEKRLVGIVSIGDLAATGRNKDLTHNTLARIYGAA